MSIDFEPIKLKKAKKYLQITIEEIEKKQKKVNLFKKILQKIFPFIK